MDFHITYYKCQSCSSQVNCNTCGRDLTESLLKEAGIRSVYFDMNAKTVSVDTDIDEDELEEILEDNGIFIG